MKQQGNLISLAWKDEAFKQVLLSNPSEAIASELGISIPPGTAVQVLEEKANSRTVVIPREAIGPEKLEQVKSQWAEGELYQIAKLLARAQGEAKFKAFRQVLLSNPKEAIASELGISIPPGTTVQVLEEKANSRTVVIPREAIGPEKLEQVKSQWGEGEPYQIASLLARAQGEAKFKQFLLSSPKQAISKALGTELPQDLEITMVSSQLDTEYIILPAKPEGDLEELSDEELMAVAGGSELIKITIVGSASVCLSAALSVLLLGSAVGTAVGAITFTTTTNW